MHKRRIGVFLNCTVDWGGQYQYCLAALDALSTLPRDDYEIIAIYAFDCWHSVCSEYRFRLYKVELRTAKLYENIHDLHCEMLIYLAEGFNISEVVPDIPVMIAVHDLNFHFARENTWVQSKLGYQIYEAIYGKLTTRAVGILVDSNFGKHQLIELYGTHCAAKTYVMPFTPPKYLYYEKNYAISNDFLTLPDKYIFYPANMLPHKNHKILIKAAKLLNDRGIVINFVFTGKKNDYYEKIQRMIIENKMINQFYFIGRIPNEHMRYVYENARAMVMPTFEGPTNIPPLEAMMLGCPVAVSRVGAMPEQVGDEGLTFDPNNVDEIALTLEKLWLDDELCERLSCSGIARMKENTLTKFNERFTAAVEDCFRRIDGRKNLIVELLEQIKGFRVICYGLGEYGYWVYRYLSREGIDVELFFDKNPSNNTFFKGKVCRIEDWHNETDDYIVLLTLKDKSINHKIRNELSKIGFSRTCLVTHEMILAISQCFDTFIHYPKK